MTDLIEHFKLDARIQGDHTVHTEYLSDPRRGVRKVKVEKRWFRQRHIGHGAFGEVWLEVHREQEQVVAERAVKSIQKRRMEGLNIDYKRELLALAKLSRHQELFVSLHGWYEDSDSVFLAMEYLQHGDLGNFIPGGITEDGARMICAQLLDGLSTMHSLDFTHRDLKPQNIFVVSAGPEWWIKIGDFGISKRISLEQSALRTQAGTRQFQAPEILGYVEEAEETSEYTNLVDIWSLGCVTHLILTETPPFVKPRALIDYCSGEIEFPHGVLQHRGVSMDGRDFVVALLNPHPSQRPTARVALQHIWLQVSPSPTGTSVEVDRSWQVVEVAENATEIGPKPNHSNDTQLRQDSDSAYSSAQPNVVQNNHLQDLNSRSRSHSGTPNQQESSPRPPPEETTWAPSDFDTASPSWSLRSQEERQHPDQGSGQVIRGGNYEPAGVKDIQRLPTPSFPQRPVAPSKPGTLSRLKLWVSGKDKMARSTDFSNSQKGSSETAYRSATNESYLPAAAYSPAKNRSYAPNEKLASRAPRLPVFGVSLDELRRRDGRVCPLIVSQCINAIDRYGLGAEGIYKHTGSSSIVQDLKARFERDVKAVDLGDPAVFSHDIHSVATLLKDFLRALPDPLFPATIHNALISAWLDNDLDLRKDLIHQQIVKLRDCNYATLRAVMLHWDRVLQTSRTNGVYIGSLSSELTAPLFGGGDQGWKTSVLQTVLDNAVQLFGRKTDDARRRNLETTVGGP